MHLHATLALALTTFAPALACTDDSIDKDTIATTVYPETTETGEIPDLPMETGDTGDTEPPICEPDPLQNLPCDPRAPECGEGHCVLAAAPSLVWVCEMVEPSRDPGEPCRLHAQCAAGLCLPGNAAPSHPAEYGVCATPCGVVQPCPAGSTCTAIGGGPISVCVEP